MLRRLVSRLLARDAPAYSLRAEVLEIAAILTGLDRQREVRRADISVGETRTSNGLALSPTMAAMCIEDFARTIQFIRGAHAAILAARARCPARPARILYVGCGPYAVLAVPLMSVLPAADATFTLLDVHADAIASAKSVVDRLELTASVTGFVTTDATSFEVSAGLEPDVILVETMQACLQSEPQVAIVRHLLKQAPDAILVPEEVRIDLVLVNPAREFDLRAPEQRGERWQRDRIGVAPVFVLNRETVASWNGVEGDHLPACAARLPTTLGPEYRPMLFTTIRVYGACVLEDYDSGLTCPRRLQVEGRIEPEDIVQFRYVLGQQPRLHCEILERHPGRRTPSNAVAR